MMRVMLYEAAQSMLHSKKWSWLKADIAGEQGGAAASSTGTIIARKEFIRP